MLQTPNVFVDTEPFCGQKFSLDSGRLKRLIQLIKAGRLRLVLPSTTRRELKKKLLEQVDEELERFQIARKKAPLLARSSNPTITNVFEEIDVEAVKAELLGLLDEYLKQAEAIDVDPPADMLEQVLDDYFDSTPPFGGGKKKHEFLDAIAVRTLCDWCEEEEESLYVVSRDDDLAAACDKRERLLHLPTLDDLFGLVQAVDTKALALVESASGEIERLLSQQLEGAGYIIMEDGDVENVEIRHIDIDDLHLQDVEDDVVLFQFHAWVTIRADVSYWDYTRGIYDSEDKVFIPFYRIDTQVEDYFDVVAYGSVGAETEALDAVRDVFVEFDSSQTFEVDTENVVYDDEY